MDGYHRMPLLASLSISTPPCVSTMTACTSLARRWYAPWSIRQLMPLRMKDLFLLIRNREPERAVRKKFFSKARLAFEHKLGRMAHLKRRICVDFFPRI